MSLERIAYVVSTFPKISETFIAGELAELCRRGLDVRVLSLKLPEEQIHHDVVASSRLLERTTYNPEEFSNVLDDFQPNLVHAHFATAPTEMARNVATARRIPFTFTAHGYDVYRRPPSDFAERAAAAAALVTVSDANSQHITEKFGVSPERIHVIPCGVDTEWFTPGTEQSEVPLIVCVARLREVKRLDRLVHACAILRERGVEFECVILGEGPERTSLETLRRELGLEQTLHLAGAAEQSEVRKWWQRAWVAVLTSHSEGMPVSLMEAAACGVPAVAPAVGGIPELIVDGVTGLIAPPGNTVAIANRLQDILASRTLRRRMSQAARAVAEQRFSRKTQIDRLLALWTEILH